MHLHCDRMSSYHLLVAMLFAYLVIVTNRASNCSPVGNFIDDVTILADVGSQLLLLLPPRAQWDHGREAER